MVVRGVVEAARTTNGYLFLAQPPVKRPITVEFPLAIQETTLEHRTREIRVRLRGDEVAALDNSGADLSFFDPLG